MAPRPSRVLFVASECFPLIKTGGLADVIGALPLALSTEGFDAHVLLPAFPAVKAAAASRRKFADLEDLFGGSATIYKATSSNGLKLFLLDAPHLFDVEGNPYQGPDGKDRADNFRRFAALAYAGAELAAGNISDKFTADVLHAHDWQAGLTAAYLKAAGNTAVKTVFTIHNLAFQGLFPKAAFASLGLPATMFSPEGFEYWDQVSFLKAGIVYSDWVTTVSPTYAFEIQTDDGGMGLGGLLKSRNNKLSGIRNGIDTLIWDPASDDALPHSFSARALAGKAKNKAALQREFGLEENPDAPLFCVVSRLTEQKGLDLLAGAIPHIAGNGGQLAVLGSGEKSLEGVFQNAAIKYKGAVGVRIGYDEPLAHRLQAGADAIFVPSRFEPCGLTQLCALRYGTVPIVARVGGLADTIVDANEAALMAGAGNGVQFSPVNFDMLTGAIDRFFSLYRDPAVFAALRQRAMKQDVSWALPAKDYASIYTRLKSAAA
ncbi:glycogen synthase GlgA [Kordiimonas gwangyangensis]|uniref:glycogen synthase GlgA n=1 Tax=Kordiimonas gwangyangensis TaxID=288022 RepID=UPI000361B641|nr:glycogen synthase GlgA [Kordiimonas gwangyangensis]